MNLDINVTNLNDKSTCAVAGEIDIYTAPKLKEAILPLTKQKGQLVEVDLENVSYMDSTGLGVFISALKSTKENDSQLKLVNLQDRVLRLFNITGLNEIMDLNSTIHGGK
ncbi:STAS domain-containing protein [Virgibacillus alimentarius]|uniref:Anti-sigma factor antagonist n=1 Tax=Virgibacillus alimentarius TaxID=698769 RepID=A0ABS4SAF5_9BACI|nr:STAS domain-containing protein [Virgibacillus alimentarius]MBP2258317.1 anti-sigma B factor antagonist [Virgibacillus alimentarius]